MSRRDTQLLAAKYKNATFFVRVETDEQFGQKRIIHTYPNTQAQYAEPQGKAPGRFSVDIFFAGENYKTDYDIFKSSVEDPTPGRLFLPIFGIIENVVAMPARGEGNHTEIGEIKVSVEFVVTVQRPSPTQATTSQQDVSSQAEITRQEIVGAFSV